MSESYCERVLSVANQVVRVDNTMLASEEVERTVMLRINKNTMLKLDKELLSVLEDSSSSADDLLPPVPPEVPGFLEEPTMVDID